MEGRKLPNSYGTLDHRLLRSRPSVTNDMECLESSGERKLTMLNNSVELLEQAIEYAEKQGFQVRNETLGGATGGLCRIGNASTIFLDQSATASQQLAEIMAVLQNNLAKSQKRSEI